MASAYRKKEKLFDYQFTLNDFENCVRYVVSENEYILKKALRSMYELFKSYDPEALKYGDRNCYVMYQFVYSTLEIKLEKNIDNIGECVDYVLNNVISDEIKDEVFDMLNNVLELDEEGCFTDILSTESIKLIDEFVASKMKHKKTVYYASEISRYKNKLDSGDFNNFSSFIDTFSSLIADAGREIAKIDLASVDERNDYSSSSKDSDSFSSVFKTTWKRTKDPDAKLKTGYKSWNNVMNGGIELGRVYTILGIPSGFKSGTLLNLALSIKESNKRYATQDKTKKPVILFLTQENSIYETTERIWNYYMGDEKGMESYNSPEEAEKALNETEWSKGIEIIVKYRPSRSISTADLDQMVEDLAIEGKECILIIQDYIKRIRSVTPDNNDSSYIEMGNIVDEFCTIAKARNLAIITAMQLNRKALEDKNNKENGRQYNLIRGLDINHISESIKVAENSDYIFIVNRELYNDQYYLCVKTCKTRGKLSPQFEKYKYFCQPFETNNSFRLFMDIGYDRVYSIPYLGNELEDDEDGDEEIGVKPEKLRRGRRPSALSKNTKNSINVKKGETAVYTKEKSLMDDDEE